MAAWAFFFFFFLQKTISFVVKYKFWLNKITVPFFKGLL